MATETFPVAALVPKAETGVVNFLTKFPNYDGRDVTIAILDSGVDPRASGLETLCDGKSQKVIERFDCTGCGDLDVSVKVTADDKGFITGLSGNRLKLTPQMITSNTAKGEYRLGMKNFYDLCPSKVREKMTNAIKRKSWDGPNKISIAEVLRKISEFDKQNPDSSKLSWEKKLAKEDLENTLDLLNYYEKRYNDIKTTYDCILYPTENGWQTVIDITEKGDLENALHIGEYSMTYEIKNVDDYLSISVNVHDEGNVLEIVGMCSPHGTHVASIASGNCSSPDVNGVSPNSKIVSLTIGDGRLGSMETGTALVRAMMKVMEMCRSGRQIDVINMSYGEHSHWSNSGRIGELMSEVVNKYGVVWVASAGNHGPALCTVGTPPDLCEPCCIGVGAYVSPQMMEAEYALREKLPANVYTWTSRDPCIDGGHGVTVCAPGGAITSVPQFTMCKSQLMNGTSMAAPHVAGAIALLISGLKQEGVEYSPYSIKRAISNTAVKVDYIDKFAQGSGLLNVEKAFEYLVEHKDSPENMMRFKIRCGPQNAKGIHIREGVLKKPIEYTVHVEPILFNEKEADPKDKINFNVRLNLISSEPFVQCGSFLDLSYVPRSLSVNVDPSGLLPGVHTAIVRAYNSNNIQMGALFDIPVTVVQPFVIDCEETRTFDAVSNRNDGCIDFKPQSVQRNFILVPRQATWAVLRMRTTNKSAEKDVGRFFVHTMQLLPNLSCTHLETMKMVCVNADTETILAFKCQENNILELCIAKYWSNIGCSHLNYNLEFHGLKTINPNAHVMHVARGIHKLVISALVREELQPSIQLKSAAVVLRPTDSKITPLSATRDVIPEGRQIYQNLLTYNLQVSKANEIALYAPYFNTLLYEAEFESQFWMLFDSNKVMICSGDAHSKNSCTKLEKGEYCIKLQIRHEKRELLEKVSEINMVALFKLTNPLTLEVYDHYNQSMICGRKFNGCVVRENPPKVLYVSPLPQEKFNKANLPASYGWLSGSLLLAKDDIGRRVDTHEFIYISNDSSKKNGNGNAASNSNASNASTSKTKGFSPTEGPLPIVASTSGDGVSTAENAATTSEADAATARKAKSNDDYAEGLRDFQCSMITKCDLDKAEQIYKEVTAAHPKYLAIHLLLIQSIESSELKAQTPFKFASSLGSRVDDAVDKQNEDLEKVRTALKRVIQLADIVIDSTDEDALLAYYGLKYDTRPDAAKIKTNMDKQKNNYLEALVKKGIATAKQSIIENTLKDNLAELDNIYTKIIKFSEPNDLKVVQFSLWHAYVHEQYGRMYKCLQKMGEDKRNREYFEELNMVAGALNFLHLQTVLQRMTVSAYPNDFRLF